VEWYGSILLSADLFAHLIRHAASTDCTVLLQNLEGDTDRTSKRLSSIKHRATVRCTLLVPDKDTGALHLVTACDDDVQIFDVSSFVEGEGEAELLATIDAHADLVTSLGLWMKQPVIERAHPDDDDIILRIPNGPVEPWIVSGGLDGTLRKWRLAS
jgi:WD40 repeat protein